MAFKPKSAAETKAAELAAILIRIADREGAPVQVGVDALRRASPRLTPLAIGQMFSPASRRPGGGPGGARLHPRRLCRSGAGGGMEFEIGPA